jgi:flagellar protein FlaG
MKVEGQGMAWDFSAVKNEVLKPVEVDNDKNEESKQKLKREDVKATPKVNVEELQAATDVLNKAMKISNYHLEFNLHEGSGRYQVKVVDTDSDKVIREIPSENILEMSAKIKDMLDKMVGVLVDELA